jgi:sugar phosphate isomerase/epimerase
MTAPGLSAFPKCFLNEIGPGRRLSVFEWIEMARTLDVEGLEIYDAFLESDEPGYLDAVRAAVEATGRCIPMFCCSPDLVHPDPAERAAEFDRQRQHLRTAARLGCRTCRVLSGQRHPEVGVEEGIQWVVGAIRSLLPLARELGIRLAMENHYKDGQWRYPEFAQKPAVFLRIVEAIDDPAFGVQYDPSNALVAGADPVAFLRQVQHRVISMHASDRYLLPGHTLAELAAADGDLGYSPILVHGEIGKGLNDYDAIFKILADIGYSGWISTEDGNDGMEQLQRSVAFLQQMRRRYFP